MKRQVRLEARFLSSDCTHSRSSIACALSGRLREFGNETLNRINIDEKCVHSPVQILSSLPWTSGLAKHGQMEKFAILDLCRIIHHKVQLETWQPCSHVEVSGYSKKTHWHVLQVFKKQSWQHWRRIILQHVPNVPNLLQSIPGWWDISWAVESASGRHLETCDWFRSGQVDMPIKKWITHKRHHKWRLNKTPYQQLCLVSSYSIIFYVS